MSISPASYMVFGALEVLVQDTLLLIRDTGHLFWLHAGASPTTVPANA